jgi:F-type H+-transporting ATPase subunit epsilon
MKLELITLSGQKMNEEVYEVILPTADGQIAVFVGHTPIVTLAVPGVISVRRTRSDPDSALEYFATNGGVVDIDNEHVRVLVDEADAAEDILAEEAHAALERAEEMKRTAKDKVELDKAQSMIDRQAIRLKVADLRRRRH